VIANSFPKRTANNVKNHYKQLERRTGRIAKIVPADLGTLSAGLFRQGGLDSKNSLNGASSTQ
jgi:hypothetical protein